MLTTLDDTLWHQLPTTFDHVGTSDPRFFDRFWYACYAPDGSSALQFTMGAYRNMDVLDAGCVVVHHGRQYNVRASRTLGSEIDTVCGPLTIRVTKPLHEFVLTVDSGDHAVHGEITWTGVMRPAEEKPHFARTRRRVTEDYQRFDQIGTARGWLEIEGARVEINDWWACRDHSWGVRPRIGIREPVTGPAVSLAEQGFAMAFLFFSTDSLAGHVNFDARGDDEGYVTGDIRRRGAGEKDPLEVSGTDLGVVLHDGTRRFSECTLTAELPGNKQISVHCNAIGAAIAMRGLGYSGGYHDRGGLGVWRGENVIEHDIWDVSHPSLIGYPGGERKDHWHRIQPVSVTVDQNGQTSRGTGSMTLILSGRIPRFGLE